MEYVERINYDSKITIKLVIPSGCNAKCEFCYMKDYDNIMTNNKDEFLDNFIPSLDYLLSEINDKDKVSLDITGNEPTFDIKLLTTTLLTLKEYNIRSKVNRVTITTNGLNLLKVIPYFEGVINYVNISVHHYSHYDRENIFGCKVPSVMDYRIMVDRLNKINIKTSAICVIYKQIDNFERFMNSFINYCKHVGFISIRFRNNVFWEDSEFNIYADIALNNDSFTIIQNEDTTDSKWCRLRMDDGFRVFFLNGVKDTSIVVKGIEYVIADNGKAYTDFYKRELVKDYNFTIGKIYDILNNY